MDFYNTFLPAFLIGFLSIMTIPASAQIKDYASLSLPFITGDLPANIILDKR